VAGGPIELAAGAIPVIAAEEKEGTSMPLPDASMSWWMTMSAVGVVALVAFLVSWLLTDLLHSPRAVYLAAMMVVSGTLTYGYLAWSGTDAAAFITNNWGWGLVGALVSGGLTARAIKAGANRRGLGVPAGRRGARLAGALVWEGLLYGAAEGLLLSALPVLAAWQSFHLLGWTATTAGAAGSGALAIGASAAVIWIHHLGYREFRSSREILLPIVACGLLSLAYLLTGSPIAPTGGHVLLHAGAQLRGVPLPPYSKGLAARSPEPRLGAAA
jgi:hypothetical protein